jgi:transposase-like protein
MSKKPKPPSYTAAPTLGRERVELYTMVLRVLSSQVTVSEAARELGMARNRFQTWMHRAQQGLIEGLTPRPAGRPESPPPDKSVAQRNEQLQHENERLRTQLERQSELMLAAGQLMREQLGRPARRGQSRAKRPTKASGNDDDEAPARVEEVLVRLVACTRSGVRFRRAASWLGRSESTLRRWQGRLRRGERVLVRRGAKPRPSLSARAPDRARQVEALVVDSRGVLGAEALRRATTGVSRRDAAGIKRESLVRLERERKARTQRVAVTQPGIIRGFDAMYTASTEGQSYALCSCDGAVPYTTSILVRDRYNADSVRLALERDFQENGVPLVLRLDRCAAHSSPQVRSLLDALGVIVLQGPPYCARFYGQLERQNRERRIWLQALGCPTPGELVSELERCRVLLNTQLARRSLGWCTAEARWCQRPTLHVDRPALREEIAERDARYRARLAQQPRGVDVGLAYRLAVINTLKQHDWLRLESRGGRYGISG